MFRDPIDPLFIGHKKVILPSCHSTNQAAADLLAAGPVEDGTLVITDTQTHGKGQRGNTWESTPYQNLTFSVILKPHFLPVEQQFFLTIVSSLALLKTLELFQLSAVEIKWPNDIYVEQYKIAGILIANSLRQQKLEASVIGVGLNVNQSSFSVENATSIRLQTGQKTNTAEVLDVLLKQLQKYYDLLIDGKHLSLKALYLENLRWKDELRNFQIVQTKETIQGCIVDVDAYGRLQVQTAGALKSFDFKEIKFLE